MNIIQFLQGKKTYLMAFCVAVVAVSQYLHWITPEMAQMLYGLFGGAGGLAALRAAIAKS